MKRILRNIVIQIAALYVTSNIASGLVFERDVISLFITGAFLSISSFVIKPVVNILLLPLNLLTFNFFRWAGNLIVLYLASLLLSREFMVGAFNFPGYSSSFIDIPGVSFDPGVLSFVAFAFLISIFAAFLHWLVSSH